MEKESVEVHLSETANRAIRRCKKLQKLNHDELSLEPFERKGYLNSLSLENARMRFKVASSVIPTVRSHFSRKYRPTSLSCPACSSSSNPTSREPEEETNPRDTASHILLVCDEYSDLKGDDFDHTDDKMLAEFFLKVVQRRIANGHD